MVQISEWSLPVNLPAGQAAIRLESLIARLATPPEAVLDSLTLSADSPEATADRAPSNDSVATAAGREIKLNTLRTQPQKVLYDLLNAVDEVLDKGALSKQTGLALHQLGEELQSVTHDLAAVHLGNVGTNNSTLVDPCYVFPIPVTTPNGSNTVFLKVFRHPENRIIDPENMRLALLFDLPELGEIAVNLAISDRHINGQVLSGKQETHRLVTEELEQLHHRLSHLGYSVGALLCDMLPVEGRQNMTQADSAIFPSLPVTKIDLTI